MPIGFVVKGQDRDIIVIGDSLEEAELELRKNEKFFKKTSLSALKIREDSGKKTKISISTLTLELKANGFFDKPKLVSEIRVALATQGHHYGVSSLS